MNNVEQTIISQYGNSATISQLIQNMNEYIDPEVNIWAFYNFVFNVQTAQGFGLDIWGRIVGLQGGRNILANPVYVLDDTAFRSVILLKALSNISASTIPAINRLLTNWMTGRGKTWVIDNGNDGVVLDVKSKSDCSVRTFDAGFVNTGITQEEAGYGFGAIAIYKLLHVPEK